MGLSIYYVGYITKKPEMNVNRVNILYLMINKIDGFIEEKDDNKYLNISNIDKSSEVLKQYAEVWNGINNCIKKINDNDGEYDKDFIKIKFN